MIVDPASADAVVAEKRVGRGPRRSHRRAAALSPSNPEQSKSSISSSSDPAISERQNRAFELRAGGASMSAIAQALGIDRGTVARDLSVETMLRQAERPQKREALVEVQAGRYEHVIATLRADVRRLGELADAAAAARNHKYECALRSTRAATLRTLSTTLASVDTLFGLRRDSEPDEQHRGIAFETALATFALLDPERRSEIFRRAHAAKALRNITPED